MREFVPGAELARAFYEKAVAPLVASVPHSAALLGWGSDVLGFDTARSTDHGWGPRLQLFFGDRGPEGLADELDAGLPDSFRGWPVRFGWDEVGPALAATLAGDGYAAREAAFLSALEAVPRRHNRLGITREVEPTARLFHSRPFRVLASSRFVDACLEEVSDPWLRSLPLTGAVDQFVDSTDVLSSPEIARRVGLSASAGTSQAP